MTLFNLVKPAIKKGKLLNPFEKFMLCMMWLRFGIPFIDLADRFQISKTTAADTFLDILNILYVKISPLIIWPEWPELQTSMPLCFRNKSGCKITTIIDCFELLIDRPTNLTACNLTWSGHIISRQCSPQQEHPTILSGDAPYDHLGFMTSPDSGIVKLLWFFEFWIK